MILNTPITIQQIGFLIPLVLGLFYLRNMQMNANNFLNQDQKAKLFSIKQSENNPKRSLISSILFFGPLYLLVVVLKAPLLVSLATMFFISLSISIYFAYHQYKNLKNHNFPNEYLSAMQKNIFLTYVLIMGFLYLWVSSIL